MSIQKKPSIRILPSKKQRTKIGGMYTSFLINPDLISVDIAPIWFTNFLLKDKVRYRFVRNEINKIKRNEINITDYELKEENYSRKNQIRIRLVYEQTYNSNNTTPLIRLKHTGSKEFQLFCQEKNGKYTIQLIDLYHLIVPAADREHGEFQADPEKKYNIVKGADINLKDFL